MEIPNLINILDTLAIVLNPKLGAFYMATKNILICRRYGVCGKSECQGRSVCQDFQCILCNFSGVHTVQQNNLPNVTCFIFN